MTTIARTSQLPIVTQVRTADYPPVSVNQLRVQMVGDGLGQIIHLPVVVIRGAEPGPVVGVTAAIHGNELNGVQIIHQLIREIQPETLAGTLILAPVLNVPGYLRGERHFNDGTDLNRIMPGKPKGTPSNVYAHRLMTRVLPEFEYLIDLHTASRGRVNSLYVRADLTHPVTAWMAQAQNPQIILHNFSPDGSLRSAAMERGIPSITVEVGNSQVFQKELVTSGVAGITNILAHLKMVDATERLGAAPVVCRSSFWMFTESGGVLDVLPELTQQVTKGEMVARVNDVYGNIVEEYFAPGSGIVIGKSIDPVNQTGSRIAHIGVLATPDDASKFKISADAFSR
jgi:predicted deacylase